MNLTEYATRLAGDIRHCECVKEKQFDDDYTGPCLVCQDAARRIESVLKHTWVEAVATALSVSWGG